MITKQAEAFLKSAEYTIADWANDERRRHDDTYYDDRGRMLAGSLGLTAGSMAAGLARHRYAKHLGFGDTSALHSALLAAAAGGIGGENLARYGYNKLMGIDLSNDKKKRSGQKKTANLYPEAMPVPPTGLEPYPEAPVMDEKERAAIKAGTTAGALFGLGRFSRVGSGGRLGTIGRIVGVGVDAGLGALAGKTFNEMTETRLAN